MKRQHLGTGVTAPDQSGGSRRYRVVQWTTGNIGARTLRGVIEHPHLDLAGVYVHTPGRRGRDAGEFCGLDRTGVTTTGDIDEIMALGADCVIYTPRAADMVLTSIQRRLDGLTIEEFGDRSQRDSPDLLFNVMGFGGPPADYDERRVSALRNSFGPSLQLLADALAIRLDTGEAAGEVATARHLVARRM